MKVRTIKQYYCRETDHRVKIVKESHSQYDIWKIYSYMVPAGRCVTEIDASKYKLAVTTRRAINNWPIAHEMEAMWVHEYRKDRYEAV